MWTDLRTQTNMLPMSTQSYNVMVSVTHCNLTCKQTCKSYHFVTELLTQLRGGLHQAPGLAPSLADDQVQYVGLQTILQNFMQRRAQVLQDEVTHVGTHPAVPQFSLVGSRS